MVFHALFACCLNAEYCEILAEGGSVIWKKSRSLKYYVEVFHQPEITTLYCRW